MTSATGRTSPLAGRVALVTGASRGIGAAIAARLARAGASVAITARTAQEGDHRFAGSLATTATAVAGAGREPVAVTADLSSAQDRRRLVESVEASLGPVDILVNNAAVTYFSPVADFDEGHFRLMFEVQVRAPFDLAQQVLPSMRERRAGWILNISSAAARHPQGPPYGRAGGGTVYGMCKAALERLTTGLASEVHGDGVAVNALSPSGLVLTPGVLHHRLDRFTPPERHEPVEYMAEAAYLLCSADPRAVTGRVTYAADVLDDFGVDRPVPGFSGPR